MAEKTPEEKAIEEAKADIAKDKECPQEPVEEKKEPGEGTSLLLVQDKPMPRCPLCAGHKGKSYNFITLPTGNHIVNCECGLLSKPFASKLELECFWRTRGGKKVVMPQIEVKHGNTIQIPKETVGEPF